MFQINEPATAKRCGNVTAAYAEGSSPLTFPLISTKPIARYMAMHRHTQSWCRPFFGSDVADIPENTVLLLLQLEDDRFCAVVPVVNALCQTMLCGGLTATMTTTCETACQGLALVWAEGENPALLIRSCVEAALKLLGSDTLLREDRPYPEIFEYLGWCTWDSMQIRVNEDGIKEKCAEFKSKNIPVKWAILDDMWAEIRDFYGKTYGSFNEMVRLMHSSRLYSFDADPYRFPHGLKHTVDHIHSCGMEVGIWFPVKGYWAGLDPEGREMILSQVKAYHRESGSSVVLVSHSMEDVARLTDRLLVMNGSKLAMDGTPDEVFTHAQELVDMGLSVPQVTQVFLKLRQRGLDVPTVYTIGQAVEALKRVRGGTAHA